MDEQTILTRYQAAQRAWNEFCTAERQIARLQSFQHRNREMQTDLGRWIEKSAQARATMNAALSHNPVTVAA